MNWITRVKYIKDYQLELEFNDGLVRIADLSPYIGGNGVFAPLQNIDYFKTVSLDSCGNTICWDNGADICPDVLYSISNLHDLK